MGFAWDVGSRIFLVAGAAFILLAGVLVLITPQAAIYPLALGATCLLAAFAMAFEGRKPPA